MEAGPICKSNVFLSSCCSASVLSLCIMLVEIPCMAESFRSSPVALQVVIHGMLFAFIYLVLQKRQVLSESKGEALFPAKISNLLLLFSIVSFIVSKVTYELI